MAMWMTTLLQIFVDALIERPQLSDLVRTAEEIDLPPPFAATVSGAMLMETRGRLALARGDRPKAARDLRAASEVYTALQFGPARTPWLSELALAVLGESPAEAEKLAARELERSRQTGLARCEGISLRVAGIVAGGARGIDLLRESLACLADTPSRLELARSQVELGAALRRLHRRADARELLTAGLDLAHRCGAERLMRRAEDELRAAGARPRRRTSTGADALTASERRVAMLAAEGRSNLEIAQELYVGLKTVEAHLSHAYAKLGLSGQGSRQRLGDALATGSER
jgi:DNA-binding CsgD family transcriptional regulator